MASEPRARAASTPGAAPPPLADEERQLAAAVLQRDRKAAAEFVARYTDPVWAYVARRLAPRSDLVEDLVQEVFLAALGALATFRGQSSLKAWLLGIARHKVETHYRQRLRATEPLQDAGRDEPAADDLSIDEHLSRRQLEARARRVVGMLPEAYAAVLLWRYWENRSVREIALATGRTEKAVERLLARARLRFRELWET